MKKKRGFLLEAMLSGFNELMCEFLSIYNCDTHTHTHAHCAVQRKTRIATNTVSGCQRERERDGPNERDSSEEIRADRQAEICGALQ